MRVETGGTETLTIPDCVVIPAGACVPPDATFYEGPDDGWCRVLKPQGERCRARRMIAYGICAGHAGRGLASDPVMAARTSRQGRIRMKERRLLLGISAAGTANPRQLARLKALERSEELAEALVNGPLDDPKLGSVQRQLAAARIVDATFPLAETTVEVEVPADPENMPWSQMKLLAARLLGSEVDGVVEGESLAIGAGEQ